MKKFTLSLFIFLFISTIAFADVNALFVNDNSANESNTEMVFEIIEQYLGELAYFNAVDSARSPVFFEMAEYNLVIWYCGLDEDDLYFWNDNYQDNPYLSEYITKGGSLWLMGRGFFNARYIKPPRNYSEGSFIYDYLGVSRWASESYNSDNGVGVPELILNEGSALNTLSLDRLNWGNPPEPAVDGCELVEGCHSAYFFGPGGYTLYGQPSAFYYPLNKSRNITFTFDPASLDSKGNASTLLSDVLRFYEDVLSAEPEISIKDAGLTIYPNPASSNLNIEIKINGNFEVSLFDLAGNKLSQQSLYNAGSGKFSHSISVSDFPGGIYFIRIEAGTRALVKSFVVNH